MLLQISATTSLVSLFVLLAFSWKPEPSGRLIFPKSEGLELLTCMSMQEVLEGEDQVRTGSFLHPAALRLHPEIIQFPDSCGEEGPQNKA